MMRWVRHDVPSSLACSQENTEKLFKYLVMAKAQVCVGITMGFSSVFFLGVISWGTATPMDVVKSRLQADGVYLNKYKGILDCILQSYQNEGLKVSGI